METLVIKGHEGRDVTTSLIIARIFNKQHSHVLRDIKGLSCSAEFRASNFGLMVINRKLPKIGERQDPYYEITKDGFSFLVMGYTGIQASKWKELFIKEFNKRGELLNNDEYIVLRAMDILAVKVKNLEARLKDKDNQIAISESTIKENAPKVEYFDEVLQAKQGITTTIIAKDLGMSATALNNLLHRHGVVYKSQKTWVLYTKYADRGYTITKTFHYRDNKGEVLSEIQTYWTEAGRKFIMDGVKKIREGVKF